MELKDIMLNRRSIRKFKDTKISDDMSVFGIFENEQMALVAYEKLKLLGVKPHICTPVSI